MPAVLTVLRSGGIYTSDHVERLRQQVARFAPSADFLCLRDDDAAAKADRPRHDWPGWWLKIEAFRFPGPILFTDLDTTIVGDLGPLLDAAEMHRFVALRDFNARADEMGSGLMAWSANMHSIYDTFLKDPQGHMDRCRTPQAWGDQGFIDPLTAAYRVHWQDILPGAVVSWKKHCRAGVPEGARVICFHGTPKPWEVGQ
ncbi:hypothetical protein [Roseicyclus marinus]|uniref:hypothetical protein n=1 Tax=Roseicyclus marinus TaxID=2161673 RepID=UPI00241007B2|nr:hypothetical protein [Roseicyclus marinus]MDG3040443.1 hypothetical protein [Roseicyclus marinus]